MNRSFVAISILIITCLFAIGKGCDPLYLVPPPKSVLTFSIDNYSGIWESNGAESVGEKRYITFAPKEIPKEFQVGSLTLWLNEPVSIKQYDKINSGIDFDWAFNQTYSAETKDFFNMKNLRTKIAIDLIKWSNKPRGLIEGTIDATFYDDSGKAYEMKGHFKAYQALGTINSFH